jgi:hypothetical protein
MLKRILYWQKLVKANRREMLTQLLLRFLGGRISAREMFRSLEKLYNRSGEERITIPGGTGLERVTGRDPLYLDIRDTIRRTYPRKQNLRPDLAESYVHTTVSRAVTTERMHEYQRRGVQKVQVVAYIDHATTPICRSMNGRIFEIGAAAQSLKGQEPLVQNEKFWEGNRFFYQTPTKDMYQPWLPPYHYNCRTRIIPYVEPVDPYEQAMDKYHNLEQLEEEHVSAILDKAMGFEFATPQKLREHFEDHKDEFGISTAGEYMQIIRGMIRNPMNNAAIAISARDGRVTLYIWSPQQRTINGQYVHDFAVFSLDDNCVKTCYTKILGRIEKNLDSEVHGKVMSFTEQDTRKGDTKMIGKHDVISYERIIRYFERDDDADELEIVSRLSMEDDWETATPELKERILAVDRIVLERFADWFEYDLFKRYIATIRRRLEIEEGKK